MRLKYRHLPLTTPEILQILFLFRTTTTGQYSCATSRHVHLCRMSFLLRHSAKQVYRAKALHSVEYLATAAVFRDTMEETTCKIQPWHKYNSIIRVNSAWHIYIYVQCLEISASRVFLFSYFCSAINSSKNHSIYFFTIIPDPFIIFLWLSMQIPLFII